jgi:tight adherence protein B
VSPPSMAAVAAVLAAAGAACGTARASARPLARLEAPAGRANGAPDPCSARPARRRRAATAVATVVGIGLAGALGPVPVLAGVTSAAAVARGRARGRAGRERARLEQQVPPWLEGVAAGLRSGAGLPTAVLEASRAAAPPLDRSLAPVVAGLDDGVDLAGVLSGWASLPLDPSVRLVVGALGVADRVGGAAAEALDGVAATVRDRVAVRAEARALATQARTSAGVLVAAPAAFGALAAATDPRVLGYLVGSSQGASVLGVAVLADVVGAAWMVRLTHRAGG